MRNIINNAPRVYGTVKRMMHKHASRFQKKHGEWLVLYAPKRQVIVMDTWNGHIYQADCSEPIVDDGFVDVQIHSKVHSFIHKNVGIHKHKEQDDIKYTLDGIEMYKTILRRR